MNHFFHNVSKLIVVSLLAASFLFNCGKEKAVKQWTEVNIDTRLSKDKIFAQLDKQDEIFSPLEKKDPMKRTSDVAYFNTKLNFNDDHTRKFNNCRTHFFHSDTLSIDIGISTGFSGWGFAILYKDQKFYTEPYYFTDADIPGFESTYKILYQKLTLDKANYKVGDSIYGKIDFKSIEISKDKSRFEHFGKGYFRAKVTKIQLHTTLGLLPVPTLWSGHALQRAGFAAK